MIDVELDAKVPVEAAPREPTTPRSFAVAELLTVGVAAHSAIPCSPPPGPTTAEHLAACLAADDSFLIGLGSRLPIPYSHPNAECAFQAQHTVRRIYLMVPLCVVLGVADSTNGAKDIMQDSDALLSAGLCPIFWLASATFMLASAVSTCVNYKKWKFKHAGIRYWCMFAFAYMYMALGIVSVDTLHTSSDLANTDATAISFRACLAITLVTIWMALTAMPLPMFILPVLYAAQFIASSTLCDANLLGIVMCATAVYRVLHDQRTLFLTEVTLLRAQNAQQKESELRLATEIQKNEQDAQMIRIGTTAVNHQAKRAISNTMSWMNELEEVIIPKLETTEINQAFVRELIALAQQVRTDNDDAFEGCSSVIIQQQVALGIYVCKSEPFEIQAYIQTHIGCRQRFQVQIEPDFPEVVYIDSKLFQSLIRNLANNTEAHSRKGSLITLRLWIVGNLLYAQFVNDAGDNHQCCLDLQSKHGENFLLRKHGHHLASVNGIGSLGMREISAVATLIHAEVSLVFEEHSAVTTLQLPYVKVRSSSVSSELVEPAPPEASVSIGGVLDYSRIVFICCDDDKAPRTMSKRMLQTIAANAESCVLGETHQEVSSVPDLVLQASCELDHHNIVCIFDQNMDYPEGLVTGTELTSKLRAQGFGGLIVIRSANDSTESLKQYCDAGADAAISKAARPSKVRAELSRLIGLRKAGAEIGFALKDASTIDGL